MDDLKLFTSLRPETPPLYPAERASLREELFGAGGTIDGPDAHVAVAVDIPRPRRWRAGVAAAALVAVGTGAVWLAITQRAEAPAAPAEAPEQRWSAGDLFPPRVTIDQPGWTVIRATDSPPSGPDAVVFDPARGIAGPWIGLEQASSETVMMVPLGDREVAVGADAGRMSAAGDYSSLHWTDAAGTQWTATGWQVDDETLVAVADAAVVDASGAVTVPNTPAGFAVAPPEIVAALGRYSEYEFANDDGATVQISFYPGGPQANAGRASGDEADRSTVALGDETVSLLSYPGPESGRFRANLARGLWAWELDGAPFTSGDEFLDLVSAVRVVDEATWTTLLPDDIVAGGAERAAAVEQLLVGVPVPAGFDLGSVDGTADRDQLIAQTSGAVACAWLSQWFTATEAGDTAAADAAAAALATSHDWPMLIEIESQGGWSQVVWEYADAVNSPRPPTQESAESGLGCGGAVDS